MAGINGSLMIGITTDDGHPWFYSILTIIVTVMAGANADACGDSAFRGLSKLWAMDHFGDRDIDAFEAWKMFKPQGTEGQSEGLVQTGDGQRLGTVRGR